MKVRAKFNRIVKVCPSPCRPVVTNADPKSPKRAAVAVALAVAVAVV